MSVNKCLFIGNLTADPEIRTMPNGEQVANFTIALNERYKAKDGNIVENVEYVRIVLYRRLAEIAAQYLHKGSQVYIDGRLKTRKWQDNNGQDRYSTEIQCDNLQMLGGRNQDAAQNQPPKQQDKQQKAQSKSQQSEPPVDAFDDNIPFQGRVMGKKITLTDADSRDEISIDVDDIHIIGPRDKGSYIILKTGDAFLAMESQSRVLKMIETAK